MGWTYQYLLQWSRYTCYYCSQFKPHSNKYTAYVTNSTGKKIKINCCKFCFKKYH